MYDEAGIRFDQSNYVRLKYDTETETVEVSIIKNGEIINPLEQYVTKTELNTILNDYVTNSEISNYVTTGALDATLLDYVTNTVFSNYKIKYADVAIDGVVTIPSIGYIKAGDVPVALRSKQVGGMFISYFDANNGAIVPSVGSNNNIYFFGEVGASITNARVGILYYE